MRLGSSSRKPQPRTTEAVLQTDGPLLILAGAGSGKTRVIAHRIAHLVSERAAPTRAASSPSPSPTRPRRRCGRASRRCSAPTAAQMWISTFHALCARLLRREAPHVGLSRDFVIYDSNDQLTVMKQALKALGHRRRRRAAARWRCRASATPRTGWKGPRSSTSAWNPREQHIGKLYALYTQGADRRAARWTSTICCCKHGGAVRERPSRSGSATREQFRYVMVDEYQDTNRPQYLLIQRLGRARTATCAWSATRTSRSTSGAAPTCSNILDFEHDFPEARVVRLERNYRSTQVILDAASAVIAQNRNRKEKRLYTEHAGRRSRSCYYRAGDDLDEAEFIARTCRRRAPRATAATTAAVLYRTNAQSRTIEDALRRAGIAYKIIGGVRFYERKEIKDALAYLRLVLNPHDDVSLRRVINVPARGIGKGVMESLEAVRAGAPTTTCQPAACGPAAGRRPPTRCGRSWTRAVDERLLAPRRRHGARRRSATCVLELTQMARARTRWRSALGKVLDRVGLPEGPARGAQRRGRGPDREPGGAGVGRARVRDRARRSRRSPDSSISCRCCRTPTRRPARRTRRVLMMTMHSAKGLEFPVVIIAGLEEGLFPHSRSVDDEAELEEERRLCYVGLTRAQKQARADVGGPAPRVRRLPVHRAVAVHRRDPAELVDEVPSGAFAMPSGYRPRPASYGDYGCAGFGGSRRQPRPTPSYAYEDEDQSSPLGLKVGLRVRHPQFGVGHHRVGGAARRRHQAGRAVRGGGHQDAARQVREAAASRVLTPSGGSRLRAPRLAARY